MTLYIDTIIKDKIKISIKDADGFFCEKEFDAPFRQSETLLPEIERLLLDNNKNFSDIHDIKVENIGGTFSSVRIGVLTANALSYALRISVNGKSSEKMEYVTPEYDSLPNITKKKSEVVDNVQ